MSHPSDEELLALVLDGEAEESRLHHLETCGECRGRLESLRADLERLRELDGERLGGAAPSLPRRTRRLPGWSGILKVAAVLLALALGGASGARWVEGNRLRVVPYIPPAPPAMSLAAVACPVGDLEVLLDTLDSTR